MQIKDIQSSPPLGIDAFLEGTPKADLLKSYFFLLAFKGLESQPKSANPLCRTCKKPVALVWTESKVFGRFGLTPAQCSGCKDRDWAAHLEEEKAENYNQRTAKCCGYQNRVIPHAGKVIMLEDMKQIIPWQQKAVDYIFGVCEGTEKKGLVLAGSTGVGKTFLMKILNNELCGQKRNTCFIKAVDLALALRKETFGDNYKTVLQEFRQVETLIVDDFGTQKNTEFVRETLFSIFDHRYEGRKRTILTTNLSVEELIEQEPRLASRLRDRDWMKAYKVMGDDLRIL